MVCLALGACCAGFRTQDLGRTEWEDFCLGIVLLGLLLWNPECFASFVVCAECCRAPDPSPPSPQTSNLLMCSEGYLTCWEHKKLAINQLVRVRVRHDSLSLLGFVVQKPENPTRKHKPSAACRLKQNVIFLMRF